MKPRSISVALLCVAAVLSSISCAHAQVVSPTPNSVVMINRGNGFESVNGPTSVNPGDTVMVNEGSANMSYPDGTSNAIESGQVHTVGNTAPAGAPGAQPGVTGAEGGVAGGGTGTIGGISTTTLAIGGVVAGGVAGAVVYANSQAKSSSP